MDIHLAANGQHLRLGMPEQTLASFGFSKPGLFLRATLRNFPRRFGDNYDYWLWLKNPEIVCFEDYRTRSLGNDPKATSLEAIFGTSIFAFIKDNVVIRLHAQIFKSAIYARGFAIDFRSCAFKVFGPCAHSKPIRIPRYPNDQKGVRDANLTFWNDQDQYLICELSSTGDNCYVHFCNGHVPAEIAASLTNSTSTIEELCEHE